MKKASLTIRYSLVQCCLWTGYASIIGFASVYLLEKGFSNTQIGLLTAVAGAVSALLQPVLATYADRPGSPSLKKIIGWTDAVLVLFCAALPFCGSQKLLTGLLFGGAIALLWVLTPLVNSLSAETQNQGRYLNFGVARGMGSVAYAGVAYLLGRLTAGLGTAVIPISTALLFSLLLLALLAFPFEKREKDGTGQDGGRGLLYFFKTYRRFTVVLLGWIFLYISHSLLNSFTYQIVSEKGGGSGELGTAMAICACVELPTMFLFGFLLKKAGCGFWFRLSTVFFVLKTVGTLWAPNMPVFYCVQVFQMLGWALISVAAVYYVNSIMAREDAVKGQAYMTMSYTVGNVLGSLLGGPLIDWAGVNAMLAFASAASALGMVIVLAASGRFRKGFPENQS